MKKKGKIKRRRDLECEEVVVDCPQVHEPTAAKKSRGPLHWHRWLPRPVQKVQLGAKKGCPEFMYQFFVFSFAQPLLLAFPHREKNFNRIKNDE